MIERDQIAAIKLIDEDQLASEEDALEEIERAIQQALGWGITKTHSVLLRISHDLYAALDNSEAVDELRGQVKGLQLTNGRLKKAYDRAQGKIADLQKQVAESE